MLSQAVVQTATGLSSIGQTTGQWNVVHYVAHTLDVLRPVFLDTRLLLGIVDVHFLAKAAEFARSRENEFHACLANNLLERMAHTVYVRDDRNFLSLLCWACPGTTFCISPTLTHKHITNFDGNFHPPQRGLGIPRNWNSKSA